MTTPPPNAVAEFPRLVLAPGRERSLLRRHPWIFSGAVREMRGEVQSGETVRVCDAAGAFLAWAAYSPSSRIRARVWSFEPEERIDADFFARRVARALHLRRALLGDDARACRLLHAGGGGLSRPGAPRAA